MSMSIIGRGSKPRVSFKVLADGREHKVSIVGVPDNYTLAALRTHVGDSVACKASVKVEDASGFQHSLSDVVAGKVIIPFLPGAEKDKRTGAAKRGGVEEAVLHGTGNGDGK